MEDLSRHLGISKSAIYHHVTSKDELLGLALNRALDALDRVVQDSRALPSGPRDQLEHLLRASVDVLFAERPYVALLLRVRAFGDLVSKSRRSISGVIRPGIC